VGLAVDGSASNDGSNLLEELRVAYLLHRLQSSEKAPSGYDVLKIATVGSAKILGRDDIGSLEVGKAGDLFAIDTRRLELVGADLDPKSLLGTVGWKGPVDYTVVNGQGHGPQRKTGESGRGKSRPGGRRAGAGLPVPLRPACDLTERLLALAAHFPALESALLFASAATLIDLAPYLIPLVRVSIPKTDRSIAAGFRTTKACHGAFRDRRRDKCAYLLLTK